MNNTSKVYYELTDSQINKPNTPAEVVIDMVCRCTERTYKRDLVERLQYTLDNAKHGQKISAVENLIEELKEEVE